MKYLKKLNMLCFSVQEMKSYLGGEFKRMIFEELNNQQIDLAHFQGNKDAMEVFTSDLVQKNNKRKEFIELFYSTILADSVYISDSTMVCFELKKNVQPNSIKNFGTYHDLTALLEENTLVDFAIFRNDGLRQFQLKQYKDVLETEKIAEFIKAKLEGYGSLGQVNLLVVLQGKNNDGSQIIPVTIDFEAIHNTLKCGKFKTNAEVLISMNDRNVSEVITQVYPSLNQHKTAMIMPSEKW